MPAPSAKAPASRIRIDLRDLRKLSSIIGRLTSLPSQVLAAQVVKLAAQGRSDEEIAASLKVNSQTSCDIVQRFLKIRFAIFKYALAIPEPIAPMPAPQKALTIRLSKSEMEQLSVISRAQKAEQRMVLRARIILSANLGLNNCDIARQLSLDLKTVRKWRR